MLCKICNKNTATIHIQEIVNGEKRTLHICTECAAKKAQDDPVLQGFNLAEMLYSLSSQQDSEKEGTAEKDESQQDPKPQTPSDHLCPACSWDDLKFRKSSGRLGCPHCYEVFSDILAPALENMHRGQIHAGKSPASASGSAAPRTGALMIELASMQKELDSLVRREEYEKAATMRDRISELKRTLASMPAQNTEDSPG